MIPRLEARKKEAGNLSTNASARESSNLLWPIAKEFRTFLRILQLLTSGKIGDKIII